MKKDGIQTRKRKQKSNPNNNPNNMANNMNSSANDTIINPKSTKYSKTSTSSGSGRKPSKQSSVTNQALTPTVGAANQQSSSMGPMGINLIPPTSGNDASIYIKSPMAFSKDENIHHHHHHHQQAIMTSNIEK